MKNNRGDIKIIIILGILIILVGVVVWQAIKGSEDKNTAIPEECQKYENDVCELFDCMVDMCWCDDSSPESPILYETYIKVNNEKEAKDAVYAYIAELMYGDDLLLAEKSKNMKVVDAIKLNECFYNVFVVDEEENETVYVVSVNGEIIKTICGV